MGVDAKRGQLSGRKGANEHVHDACIEISSHRTLVQGSSATQNGNGYYRATVAAATGLKVVAQDGE